MTISATSYSPIIDFKTINSDNLKTKPEQVAQEEDQFIPVAFVQEDEAKLDFFTKVKIGGAEASLKSAVTDLKTEVKEDNQAALAKEIFGKLKTLPVSQGLTHTLSKVIARAKVQGIKDEALNDFLSTTAHLAFHVDRKPKQGGGFTLENLKETYPDYYGQEASTRSLQALDRAVQTLDKEADKATVFAAALENGIATQATPDGKEDPVMTAPQIIELSSNIGEVITKLDPKAKKELFKAAGVLMNWKYPLDALGTEIQKDTSAENNAYRAFLDRVQHSVSPSSQEKITRAFLDQINEKYFAGKLDKTTLEQLSQTRDPLRFVDQDTRTRAAQEMLEANMSWGNNKPKQVAASINTLVNLAKLLKKPEAYLSDEKFEFESYVGDEFDFAKYANAEANDTRIRQATTALEQELDKLLNPKD